MHRALVFVLLAGLVTSSALAQRVASAPAFRAEEAFGVAWVDGELRAGSRGYAARFEPGLVEITPALGRAAPRCYPLRVALRSVRRGSQALLAVTPGHVTDPRLLDESVVYDHGDGIVERYDVRAGGLKQSVVFAERPAGAGDLVVSYAVVTDLECAPAERARELAFRAGDLGGITIGAVIGIDATGRRAEGHMAFDGQVLQLVLPGGFVETAAYPLDLDPLFGPQLNTGVSFQDHVPDVAYDATHDVYGVVFEFPMSATSTDVWIMRHDAATGTRLGGGSVGSGGGSQRHPAIASINQSDRFLVVWEDDGAGNADIKCRGVRASDGALSQPVTIANTLVDELAPDVGGDAFDNLDLEALVVWEEVGTGIVGVEVTLAATGDPVLAGPPVTLDPGPQSHNPTISKSGGMDPANGGRYVVAWEASIGGAGLIGFLGVDRDLNVLTSTSFAAGGVAGRNPDVDGDGTRFLLVFEALEGVAPAPSDIWCQPLEICAGTALCGPNGGPLANRIGADEVEPAVACLGPMFAVAWSDSNVGSTTDYRIAVTNVVPGTCQLCNVLERTGNTAGQRNRRPAMCAKRSGGADSQEGLLSYEQLDNLSGNSLLRSHRYRPFTGGTVSPLPGVGGCGAGGTCGTDGAFAVGNSWFEITLAGADPTASLAFLLFDTTASPPSTCGPCAWINPQVVAPLLPVTGGSAAASMPLPCDAGFLGFTMAVQWLVLTPGAAAPPCPQFPFASASDAIRLVLAN